VLFINVVISSIVILLKGNTVGVVHAAIPKDFIYLNLSRLSYTGNILSHHSILGQLKPMLNIVTNFGGTLLVAQLVEAQHYKPEGRGLDSRWCHWNFALI
jgi:hypothetical protein